MLLTDKVSQFATDSNTVHAWVNGPASGVGSSIVTDAGLVRTPAKLIADKEAEINLAAANLPLLAGSAGSSLVGYMPAGIGAGSRTVESKLRERVSVKDFGAVGDGITDDSVAVYKTFDYAKEIGAKIWFPAGIYRVTYGYTQSTAFKNIFLEGNGRVNERVGTSVASVILLDSTNSSSFFLNAAARMTVICEGMTFRCAQFVQDRAFFKFSGTLHNEFFSRCSFEHVERPIVWTEGSYFQNASYRDTQFANSGSFHSENTTLAGTLLLIDNVNHESGVPLNTEKIVCNLTGIRQILANNFLLEGAFAQSGWTFLKLSNPYDAAYTRATFALFNNFHSEWSGAFTPDYTIDQVSGNVKINYITGLTVVSPYKLSALASVDIESTSFSGTNDDVSTLFSLEDAQCVVRLSNCSTRNFNMSNLAIKGRDIQTASITNGCGQVVRSNLASDRLYRWSGGYFLADNVSSNYQGATTNTPSTDATYQRKMVITTPAGTGGQNIKIPVIAPAGTQVTVVMLTKLPTFTSGLWLACQLNVGALEIRGYSAVAQSGTVETKHESVVAIADITEVFVSFGSGTATATGGTVQEIYALEVFLGNDVPSRIYPNFPNNIVTYNAAIPTAGSWKKGDVIKNNAPAVGQPKGWVCTVTGTPGTWVSEGNL